MLPKLPANLEGNSTDSKPKDSLFPLSHLKQGQEGSKQQYCYKIIE